MRGGTDTRTLAIAGIGAVVVGGGAIAWATRAASSSTPPSGVPATADGPANLAVAWWPQDVSLTPRGDDGRDATLRFQSTIANLGGEPAAVAPGDRVEYVVTRSDLKGSLGEVVGHGFAPLRRGELQPFPVDVGAAIGRPASSFGRQLADLREIPPRTATIVGAGHPSQAIVIRDARAGHYTLRQELVRDDHRTDAARADDIRLTEFRLDGRGGILHLGSRYAAEAPAGRRP